jgi:membrane-associated protein
MINLGILINVLLHMDKYFNVVLHTYGIWTYALLFLIVFCETGLVVTPFLPGDSILFAAGALASIGSLKIFSLFVVFYSAAVLGDTFNYLIGHKIGKKFSGKENLRFVRREHLYRAQSFYERHGSMTIVIGRFIPIVRTFVPFVAGIGKMKYSTFIAYNMLGGLMWISLFLGGGYFFGSMPFIKEHFSYFLIGIIAASIIPAVFAYFKEKENKYKYELGSF